MEPFAESEVASTRSTGTEIRMIAFSKHGQRSKSRVTDHQEYIGREANFDKYRIATSTSFSSQSQTYQDSPNNRSYPLNITMKHPIYFLISTFLALTAVATPIGLPSEDMSPFSPLVGAHPMTSQSQVCHTYLSSTPFTKKKKKQKKKIIEI